MMDESLSAGIGQFLKQKTLQGNLWKMNTTGMLSHLTWSEYWFSLEPPQLLCFQHKGDLQSIASLDVLADRFTVSVPTGNFGYHLKENNWGFQISSNGNLWCLMAKTETDRSTWITELRSYNTEAPDRGLDFKQKLALSKLFPYPREVKAFALVRTYALPVLSRQWVPQELSGAALLVEDPSDGSVQFNIVNIESLEITFEYRIPQGMKYVEDTPSFHSFDWIAGERLGFSFASQAEAQIFYALVLSSISKHAAPKEEPEQKTSYVESAYNSIAGYFATPQSPPLEISEPTNVAHLGHIGLDNQGKFETRIPPDFLKKNPEWRDFFVSAGVKQEELEHEEMSRDLVNFASKFMATQAPTMEDEAEIREWMKKHREAQEIKSAEKASNLAEGDSPSVQAKSETLAKDGVSSVPKRLDPQEEVGLRDHLAQFLEQRRKEDPYGIYS